MKAYNRHSPYYRKTKNPSLFQQIKAHSGDTYNDIADAQVKAGRFISPLTMIKHDHHLPNQTDKDIRKCISAITLENHLNHYSLSDIKQYTTDKHIEWSLSSKWFNNNSRSVGTSAATPKILDGKSKLQIIRYLR
ncbi:hypothetical protein RhiirA5_431489 [Rhizophagus irregularis]|uniref:RNase H type-1 domain-containing protein n=1 Tax=Rhizophagus irregularis TaxID=588596 RepID=A0A2N0NUU4_9GLOM|nr:hypothetical protein RhiirA5_431489 [Rhizophagus irregularis]